MNRIISPLLTALALCFCSAYAHAGNTRWLIKLVDENEQPIPNAQVFWRLPDSPDWQPVRPFMALGENQDGGGFQLTRDTIGEENFRQNATTEFLQLQVNYYFVTNAMRAAWGYLKIVQPNFVPAELQVGFPEEIHFQRIMLSRRPDMVVAVQSVPNPQQNPPAPTPPVNTIRPSTVRVLVLNQIDPRVDGGPPLAGAVVQIRLASGEMFSGVTGPNGVAQIQVSLPGRIEIAVQKAGFGERRWIAGIDPGVDLQQRIALSAAASTGRR